jgi:thioredoxin-related protein
MKKLLLLPLLLLLATCSKASSASLEKGWFNFSEGSAKALKEKKPFFVDVYTDWCGVCKKMDKDTFNDPEVKKYIDAKLVGVKLNAENPSDKFKFNGKNYTAPEFAEFMHVEGYPTILFFDKEGKLVTALPGYADAKMFKKILVYIVDEIYKTKPFDDYLKSTSI